MKNTNNKIFGALLLAFVLVIGGCSTGDNSGNTSNNTTVNTTNTTNNTNTTDNEQIFCAQDVKICSDGTAVSRDPENECLFPACSDEKNYVSEDPEECKLIKFFCVEGKRPFFDDKGCGCEPIVSGKLQAYDCPQERPQACTKEYAPVCGQVQVQCVRAPCPPINITYGNKCEACANSLTMSYTEGICTSGTTE